jgi:hypothetical protein
MHVKHLDALCSGVIFHFPSSKVVAQVTLRVTGQWKGISAELLS